MSNHRMIPRWSVSCASVFLVLAATGSFLQADDSRLGRAPEMALGMDVSLDAPELPIDPSLARPMENVPGGVGDAAFGPKYDIEFGMDQPFHATAEAAGSSDLAKQLANPIAALISVPFQNNYDFGLGPNSSGTQWKMNIQPVIPISISEDWNLITRTILPVISQRNVAGTQAAPSGTQNGIGDTVMSLWLSPKAPSSGGWIWGVGPAFNLKTASDTLLGSGKWGMGPTAVALKQMGPWSFGGLVNHLWGIGGDDDRADLNNTFLQPFVSYTIDGYTLTLSAESSYNWTADQWTIPVNLFLAKVTTIGEQPVQFQFGGRWYPAAGDFGPSWGLRASLVFMFPKGAPPAPAPAMASK